MHAHTQNDGPRRKVTLDIGIVNVMYLYAFIHALGTIIQKMIFICLCTLYMYMACKNSLAVKRSTAK